MFTTDSFINAEVTYRADRIRREWDHHRPWLRTRHPEDDAPASR